MNRFLALVLAGILVNAWAVVHFNIYGEDIEINVTDGGRYSFEPKKAIFTIMVSAGTDSRIFIDEMDYWESPENVEVYKFYEMSRVNAISDINMTFVIPKNWIESVGGSKEGLVVMEKREDVWSEINSVYVGSDDIKHFMRIHVETLPKLIALGVEVFPEETEDVTIEDIKEEVGEESCAVPGAWSECENGRRTRTVEILVNGMCVSQEETGICFTNLNKELIFPKLIVAFVLLTVGMVSYFIFKLKGL